MAKQSTVRSYRDLSAALTFCGETDVSGPLSALDELRRMLNVLQRTLKQTKA